MSKDFLFLTRGLGISLSFERKLDHLSGLVLSRLKFPFSDSGLPRDSFSLSGLAASGQSTEVIEPWVQSAVGIPSSTVIRDGPKDGDETRCQSSRIVCISNPRKRIKSDELC
jgi:hypothetical protein